MSAPTNILHVIQYWGKAKDLQVPGADDKLRGAIERLKRQNPFLLQPPKVHVSNAYADS